MEGLIEALHQDRLLMHAIVFALFATVGALWVVMASVHSLVMGAHKERSRREIAAYVAEGALTTDQAERLISAGSSPTKKPSQS